MLYADSPLLDRLAYVVMDEVHYLADRFRGAVWEEVIIHLPEEVRLVSLSATVSNAEEFGDWLQAVRGDTDVIVSEDRPVPLEQHVLVKAKLHRPVRLVGAGGDEPGEPRAPAPRAGGRAIDLRRGRRAGGAVATAGGYHQSSQGSGRVERPEVIELLHGKHLLPAIVFIFSRAGCDQAVRQVLRSGIRLTEPPSATRSARSSRSEHGCCATRTSRCSATGSGSRACSAAWRRTTPGMLPAFKEVVEELFQLKLLKVVFATETLALGVNMPARSVVLEKLEKFNGEARVPITPGEYTQLTGRAGRRGIDVEGHSVIQWVDGLDPEAVAALASRRSYPLNSSFKPTYNMAVNLIDQFGRERTRQILELSFAQFQADRAVVDLARTLRKQEESMAGLRGGDALPPRRLRRVRRPPAAHRRARAAGLEGQPDARAARAAAARARRGAQGDAGASVPRLRRARAARALGRALVAAEAGARPAVAADPHAHRAGRQAVRPGRRGARAARLPRARRARIARLDVGGTHPEAHLRRTRPARGRVPAAGPLGRPRRAVARGDGGGLVYEPRRDDRGEQFRLPRGRFRDAFERTTDVWSELDDLERDHRLAGSDQPSPALATAMHAWAGGAGLGAVLADTELAAGDFVRLTKQVVDLLDQVSIVADAELGATARAAIDAVRRGVVAYGSVA